MCVFINSHIDENAILFWKNLMFGILEDNTNLNYHLYMTIILILLATFHIHKSKFTGKKSQNPTNSPKTQNIKFIVIYDQKKQHILTFKSLKPPECLALCFKKNGLILNCYC